MILLTDRQSRLAITFGSIFLGIILVIFAYFNGNKAAVKPDYRKVQSFVYKNRVDFKNLFDSMVSGKKNFAIIGFKTPYDCMKLYRYRRFIQCYNKSKLDDLKWVRSKFSSLISPLLIYGSDANESYQYAVYLKYYGYNVRMLNGGIDEFLFGFLHFPQIVNNDPNQIPQALTYKENSKKRRLYDYWTGKTSETQKEVYNESADLSGVVEFVSKKNRIFQVKSITNDKVTIVPFSNRTRFVDAINYLEFETGDLVDVWLSDDNTAKQIKRNVVKIPSHDIIKTRKLDYLIQRSDNISLIDIRAKKEFNLSHIPKAMNIEMYKLDQILNVLRFPKNETIIIYGSGPTQPTIRNAYHILLKKGFTKIKIYTDGINKWKREKRLIVINSLQLVKNLNEYLIIDIRPQYLVQISQIKNAHPIEAIGFVKSDVLYQENATPQKYRMLKNIPDKGSPIVLYGSHKIQLRPKEIGKSTYQPDVNDVYDILISWGYRNVVVLEGGFEDWRTGFPIEKGQDSNEFVYRRIKKKPGAVSLGQFKKFLNQNVTIIDVRTTSEVETGKVSGSLHIPIESLSNHLNKLDKSKQYIFYCANGMRAKSAYEIFKNAGYKKISYLNTSFR